MTPIQPRATPFFKAVAAIAWKDLRAELRSREMVSAMLLFAVLAVVTFSLALSLNRQARQDAIAGVLWVTLAFAGTLGFNRSLAQEKDRGSLDALLLAPVDRSTLFFGKMIGNVLFMLAVGVVLVPLLTVLFGVSLFAPALWAIMTLGIVGFAAVGTLLASITVHARGREMLLPIVLLPVALPLIIAAVNGSRGVIAGEMVERWLSWPFVLLAYDLVFMAAAYMLFDFVVEE
ncbi:MAG: heme exporter protein CcmB [Anaerolineae bacterium]|nr:heme exporter protein CcmB [Anaerolineae bacterium]